MTTGAEALGGTSCDYASGYPCWARQGASLGFLLSVAECLISAKIQYRMRAISRSHTKHTQCTASINKPKYSMSQQSVSCSRNTPLLWKLRALPVLDGRQTTPQHLATCVTIYQSTRRNIPEDSIFITSAVQLRISKNWGTRPCPKEPTNGLRLSE